MSRAKTNLSPKATYVARGYGQVEPNKLSARYNGKIFAQLPVEKNLKVLENGMFVKYDYAKGVVDLTGPGEWMLVYNEVKIYDPHESEADFAMIQENYSAQVYNATGDSRYAHYLNGETLTEYDSTDGSGLMPDGSTMVPRLFKTDIGDIMTTNTIVAAPDSLAVEDTLVVGEDGYLTKGTANDGEMAWQVVKVYTMPDLQPGVKIMRIA